MHGMYIGDVQAKEQSYTRELVLMFNFFFLHELVVTNSPITVKSWSSLLSG